MITYHIGKHLLCDAFVGVRRPHSDIAVAKNNTYKTPSMRKEAVKNGFSILLHSLFEVSKELTQRVKCK